MMNGISDQPLQKCGFEDALDLTSFGKYNVAMLTSCCLIVLAMCLDIFGLSVPLPFAACDLKLTTNQQGILTAMPLVGVMVSSYAWGLCSDILGRRKTLIIAMPIGSFLSLASTFAPSFAILTTLKLLPASFISSANAAAYVLMGETVSRQHRSQCMFVMASATMCSQIVTCVVAIPVFNLDFRILISWLNLEYRPWRLLLLIISLPGVIGTIGVAALHESPKFLLSKGRDEDALNVLKCIHNSNF